MPINSISIAKSKPKNRMQVAYTELKEAICCGSIQAGTLLSEQKIAEELKISRTPVREALVLLENEGLVDIQRGIGAYVKPLSAKDIFCLFQVRKPLELLAVQTAIYNIRPSDIDQLRIKFNDLLTRHETQDIPVEEFSDIDGELHHLLNIRCENPYVQHMMNTIYANIRRLQTMSFKQLSNLRESTQQHLHLLDLIEKKDLPALEKALSEHLDWSYQCFALEL